MLDAKQRVKRVFHLRVLDANHKYGYTFFSEKIQRVVRFACGAVAVYGLRWRLFSGVRGAWYEPCRFCLFVVCRLGHSAEGAALKRKNQAAVALGRLGGKARASKLTDQEREEIARLGGLAKAANRSNGTAAALVTETDLAESASQTQKRKA